MHYILHYIKQYKGELLFYQMLLLKNLVYTVHRNNALFLLVLVVNQLLCHIVEEYLETFFKGQEALIKHKHLLFQEYVPNFTKKILIRKYRRLSRTTFQLFMKTFHSFLPSLHKGKRDSRHKK